MEWTENEKGRSNGRRNAEDMNGKRRKTNLVAQYKTSTTPAGPQQNVTGEHLHSGMPISLKRRIAVMTMGCSVDGMNISDNGTE